LRHTANTKLIRVLSSPRTGVAQMSGRCLDLGSYSANCCLQSAARITGVSAHDSSIHRRSLRTTSSYLWRTAPSRPNKRILRNKQG